MSVLCSLPVVVAYVSVHLSLVIGILLCNIGLKECGLGTQRLGLDWSLSKVGTGVEQQICSCPHRLIIRASLPGPETENTHTHTPILKKTPTWTTQMITPKIWRKKKGQRVKFIRDHTRAEKKNNPKRGKFSILLLGSRTNVTSGTWINCSRSSKRNNRNIGCSTTIFRLLCNPSSPKT